MIRLKLNLRKLADFRTFTGKDGREYAAFPIEANAVYLTEKSAFLDITLMDNKQGRDDYGNDGFATLDLGKERRQAGEKSPILGNWKNLDARPPQGRDVSAAEAMGKRVTNETQADDDSDETIPF